MSCPFCEPDQWLLKRVFYDEDKWFAFLAAPYHTEGHSIVAAKPSEKDGTVVCPRVDALGWTIIKCFDSTLANVAGFLMKYFRPKDILFASVRGDISHFHCHLIPLWDDEEKAWRRQKRYDRGHLLEYLGFLEKCGEERAVLERIENRWTVSEQRKEIANTLERHLQELRRLTGYQRA